MQTCSTETEEWIEVETKGTNTDVDAAGSSDSRTPLTSISAWTRWVLGSVVGIAVPLYKRILRREDAVEKAADSAAEAVEKIAEVTEKIASDVADELPDGGRLKDKAVQVEQICEEVEKDAEGVEAFIHKTTESKEEFLIFLMNDADGIYALLFPWPKQVDHVKEEVDTMVEPIIEKGEKVEQEIQEQETPTNSGVIIIKVNEGAPHGMRVEANEDNGQGRG
ncbi:hypothetical protein MUK42_11568 [Musa troglodytarum]|uniref:Uncharacterized protein n=1 Tax=Musa troglodytarum TaxID=320322 RepID=A0A9E7GMV0_9LILI|nr:hypothetical protein MUK42_11568 [Musa troglodytarum]